MALLVVLILLAGGLLLLQPTASPPSAPRLSQPTHLRTAGSGYLDSNINLVTQDVASPCDLSGGSWNLCGPTMTFSSVQAGDLILLLGVGNASGLGGYVKDHIFYSADTYNLNDTFGDAFTIEELPMTFDSNASGFQSPLYYAYTYAISSGADVINSGGIANWTWVVGNDLRAVSLGTIGIDSTNVSAHQWFTPGSTKFFRTNYTITTDVSQTSDLLFMSTIVYPVAPAQPCSLGTCNNFNQVYVNNTQPESATLQSFVMPDARPENGKFSFVAATNDSGSPTGTTVSIQTSANQKQNLTISTSLIALATAPSAPTILDIGQAASNAPVFVNVSLPYSFCGLGCNDYDLDNVSIYYWQTSDSSLVGTASWSSTPHRPNVGLNYFDYTNISVLGLTPQVTYDFVAAAWSGALPSTNSSISSFTTLNYSYIPPPPPTHVGNGTTFPENTSVPSTLASLIVLVFSNYQFDGSTYYATATWTNHLNATFDGEFAIEGSFLSDATGINLTANGVLLTPSHQFGVGNNTLFVFPGVVSTPSNGTVAFRATFDYTPPSPLSTGVTLNGSFFSLGELFDWLAALAVIVVAYLSVVMKRVGALAILGTVLIFLTVGLELFG